MITVNISPKYQIIIPKEIRKRLKLTPGQKLQIMQLEDRIELMPLKEMKTSRGMLKGMDTTIHTEEDRL